MKHIPFQTDFYSYIIPSNKEYLLNLCENSPKVKNQTFLWGSKSVSEKIRINPNGFCDALKPAINEFFTELGATAPKINVHEVWKNIYKKGYHQELHYHPGCDLSCVIFLDDYKEGQSKFYFSNRHSCEITNMWEKYVNIDSWYMYPERGGVIFFPSHMLHGVTPHNLSRERKTISINISFD